MDPLKQLQEKAQAEVTRLEESSIGEKTSESLRSHGYIAHRLETFLVGHQEKIDAVTSVFPFLMKHHEDEFVDELYKSNTFKGYVETDSLALTGYDDLRDQDAELVLFSASRDHWAGHVEEGRWHGSYRNIDLVVTIAAIGASKGFHFSILHDFLSDTRGSKVDGTEIHSHLIDELVLLTERGSFDPDSNDHYPVIKPLTEDDVVTTIQNNLAIAYDTCLKVMLRNYGSLSL